VEFFVYPAAAIYLHIAKFEDALTLQPYFIVAIAVGSLAAQPRARESCRSCNSAMN